MGFPDEMVYMSKKKMLLAAALAAILTSCASMMDEDGNFFTIAGGAGRAGRADSAGRAAAGRSGPYTYNENLPTGTLGLTGLQMKLVEGTAAVLGADSLVINGRTFTMDCTGTVLAIYWYAGIDLAADFGRYQGNGVARLYRSLDARGRIVKSGYPAPGDILFWDNTYDANEDGRFNDEFTHVGMVVHVLDGGTVEYVHYNYSRGIVLERMNLSSPDSRAMVVDGYQILINSPIRARNSPPAPGDVSLSSQLLRGIGQPWKQ